MESIPFQVEKSLVENPPQIFGGVRFLVEGNVDQQIIKMLENGGAILTDYMGLNAPYYMIAGDGADVRKVAEAEEIFDVPVVQPRWVVFSVKAGKLLPVDGFEDSKKLFSGLWVCCEKLEPNDRNVLWANFTYHGGKFQHCLTMKSTHLVTNQTGSTMYRLAIEHNKKVVCCDWITDCIKAGYLLDEAKYHPQLLFTPSP